LQVAVYTKLETDERFLESFKRSIGYVKLLAELDLLKDPSAKSEAGEDDRISTGDSNSLNGEGPDDISTGMQPSCFSIYGDRMSLNSVDSANYSYNSGCATSTNEAGSIGGNTNLAESSDKLDKINSHEEPHSLPTFLSVSSTTTISDKDTVMDSNLKSNKPDHLKSRHKR
jgi:hypothetical protein